MFWGVIKYLDPQETDLNLQHQEFKIVMKVLFFLGKPV